MGVGGQHWHLLSTLNPNPDKELKWQHWTVQVPWLSLDTTRLLSYSFPELSMDRCVPDTRHLPVIPCRDRDCTPQLCYARVLLWKCPEWRLQTGREPPPPPPAQLSHPLTSVSGQGATQEGTAGPGEEEPGVGPREEGEAQAPGQVSASWGWAGGEREAVAAKRSPAFEVSELFILEPVLSVCREVRPDTQYTGRKRKPRF